MADEREGRGLLIMMGYERREKQRQKSQSADVTTG